MIEDKTVLITGGAGFIGSTLSKKLLTGSNRIFVIDDLSTGSERNLSEIALNPGLIFIQEDLRSSVSLDRIIMQSDMVLHFAAHVGVDLSVRHPGELFINNVLASDKVIKSCSRLGKPLFLASSSEVYGRQIRESMSENDYSFIGYPYLSRWVYSISKIADEFLAYAFKREGLPVIIGRFFNFIGLNQTDRYGMVVPKFINQALKDEDLTIYGDGSQRRCFCDVNDGCNAILSLLDNFDRLSSRKMVSYNIGSFNLISILDLAKLVVDISGSRSRLKFIPVEELPEGFDEIQSRNPDISLIKETTGWEPVIKIEDTIRSIVKSKSSL